MAMETKWERNSDPVGIWEHRGKVALVGRGHSATDRRWDGVSLDRTLGAYSMVAARNAMEDAGISPDDVDGVITSPGGQPRHGRFGAGWAPRPYFDPPYDTEDGLTYVTAEWFARQLGLKKVKYLNSHGETLWNLIGLAAQAVGDGRCEVCLVPYPNGNLEGRYHQTEGLEAGGPAQWSLPWGWGLSGQGFIFDQYCRKYGTNHDRMAPLVVQERKNGLLWPHSYYALHEPEPFTEEDYVNGRSIARGLSIFDCDRPVQAAACYVVTTAERARDMKQKPVYFLDHTEGAFTPRSLVQTLDESEEWSDILAQRALCRLGPQAGRHRSLLTVRRLRHQRPVLSRSLRLARREAGRSARLLRRRHLPAGAQSPECRRGEHGNRAHAHGFYYGLDGAAPGASRAAPGGNQGRSCRHDWRPPGQRLLSGAQHQSRLARILVPRLRGAMPGSALAFTPAVD